MRCLLVVLPHRYAAKDIVRVGARQQLKGLRRRERQHRRESDGAEEPLLRGDLTQHNLVHGVVENRRVAGNGGAGGSRHWICTGHAPDMHVAEPEAAEDAMCMYACCAAVTLRLYWSLDHSSETLLLRCFASGTASTVCCAAMLDCRVAQALHVSCDMELAARLDAQVLPELSMRLPTTTNIGCCNHCTTCRLWDAWD
jgi:hypothetical protein